MEEVDPFNFIDSDSIDEELEEPIKNPKPIRFRPQVPHFVTLGPEEPLTDSQVDIANRNVELSYDIQGVDEKYVVLEGDEDFGLVETHSTVRQGSVVEPSVSYYLVTPEQNLFYDGSSYFKTPVRRPWDAYQRAPELYQQAKRLDDQGFESALELRENQQPSNPTVPPPEDSVFGE